MPYWSRRAVGVVSKDFHGTGKKKQEPSLYIFDIRIYIYKQNICVPQVCHFAATPAITMEKVVEVCVDAVSGHNKRS